MSDHSTFLPRAGHRREPGADPVPEKRKSTLSPTEAEMAESKPSRATAQPRTRSCGSHKPKERLRKDLLNLIVQEGLLELLEPQEPETPSEPTEVPTPKQSTLVFWGENADGRFVAKNSDGTECEPEEKAPSSTSELQHILAERKIKDLLSKSQLVLDLGPLVEAALKNQKLRDQLLGTSKPPTKKKSGRTPPKKTTAKVIGCNSRGQVFRGTIKTSQTRGVKIAPTSQKLKKKKGDTVH